jgi:hypothetical protein
MEVAFEWDILEEEIPALFEKLTEKVGNEFTRFKEDTILRKYRKNLYLDIDSCGLSQRPLQPGTEICSSAPWKLSKGSGSTILN